MSRYSVSLDEIRQLDRQFQQTIPAEYMDENRHMNVQYYLRVVEGGISAFYIQAGMGDLYERADLYGNYALEQHIRYFAEVLQGDLVSVYVRLLDLSPKHAHFMGFLVNETREQLAASVEAIAMNVDMKIKRGAPFPSEVFSNLEQILNAHQSLPWEAPACGVMRL